MKIIPRQSVCPHCGTIYRYADLSKIKRKNEENCYHCKKSFNISRKGYIFLAIELVIIYAVINVLAIGFIVNLTFLLLFLINAVPALAAVWLHPYYIELKNEHNA